MNNIENAIKIDYLLVFIGVFIILFAVKEIIEIISYFKNKFRVKFGVETDKEGIEKRVSTLEKHDTWQYNKLIEISKGIDSITETLLNNEVQSLRWEIIDFCSALANGRTYNKEAFDHIFRTYEDYEKILEKNEMTNGYVEESMKVIKEIYREQLLKGELH